MICPHCGTAAKLEWEKFEPHNLGSTVLEDGGYPIAPLVTLEYAHCPNCQRLTVRTVAGYLTRIPGRPGNQQPQEMIFTDRTYEWLIPKFPAVRKLSGDAPAEVRSDFEEASILVSVSPKASAAVSRRLLQHILRDYCGVKAKDLVNAIGEYIEREGVPSYITEALDGVRQAGNFAAHPIKDQQSGEIVPVEPGEAEWNLDTLEELVDFVFVQPKKLQARREAMNAKLEKAGKPKLRGREERPE